MPGPLIFRRVFLRPATSSDYLYLVFIYIDIIVSYFELSFKAALPLALPVLYSLNLSYSSLNLSYSSLKLSKFSLKLSLLFRQTNSSLKLSLSSLNLSYSSFQSS